MLRGPGGPKQEKASLGDLGSTRNNNLWLSFSSHTASPLGPLGPSKTGWCTHVHVTRDTYARNRRMGDGRYVQRQ